jgi:hypothetical protein
LLLGVVLLTPVVPLVAFASKGWSSTSDSSQHHSLAVAGIIVALALALMFLGSLPSQLRSPISTLYRALDKLVKRFFHKTASDLPVLQRDVLRLLAGVGWIVLAAIGLAVLAAAVYGLVRLVDWIDGQVETWKTERFWLLVVAAGAAAAGWVVGYWTGWRLQSWFEVNTDAGPVYQARGVSHSSGVAATWSVIYGTCYAIIAVGIIWW